jgi:hypothetical protein
MRFGDNFGVNLTDSEKKWLDYYCDLTEKYDDPNDFPMPDQEKITTYRTFCYIVDKLKTEELQQLNQFFADEQLKHLDVESEGRAR